MVQARQIVVYSRAYLVQWSPAGKQLALAAFENARRQYRSPDEIRDGSFPFRRMARRPTGRVISTRMRSCSTCWHGFIGSTAMHRCSRLPTTRCRTSIAFFPDGDAVGLLQQGAGAEKSTRTESAYASVRGAAGAGRRQRTRALSRPRPIRSSNCSIARWQTRDGTSGRRSARMEGRDAWENVLWVSDHDPIALITPLQRRGHIPARASAACAL